MKDRGEGRASVFRAMRGRRLLGMTCNDLLSKPLSFAMSHGIEKLRQKYF